LFGNVVRLVFEIKRIVHELHNTNKKHIVNTHTHETPKTQQQPQQQQNTTMSSDLLELLLVQRNAAGSGRCRRGATDVARLASAQRRFDVLADKIVRSVVEWLLLCVRVFRSFVVVSNIIVWH
jgi:hypothetical protein